MPGERLRQLGAELLMLAFPARLEAGKENLQTMDEMLLDGYGMVVVLPHFSSGDGPRGAALLMAYSEEVRKQEMVVPVALHQSKQFGLPQLCRLGSITAMTIVTQNTLDKEAELRDAGEFVPWNPYSKELHLGDGSKEYLNEGVRVLGSNGVVLLTPQGERLPSLEPGPFLEKHALGFLDAGTRRQKLDKVGYIFTGIKVRALKKDYSQSGVNPLKIYDFTFGQPMTREELHDQASRNGRRIDEEGFHILNGLAPEGYRSNSL